MYFTFFSVKKQAVREPPQYAPAPLLPLLAPKRLAPQTDRACGVHADRNVIVGFHGQYVPMLTAAAAA